MAAMLFARAGVKTVLLEKHADFLRDFRGDTIHPSTLQVMDELGLLDAFLERPHQEVTSLAGNLGDTLITVADFTHLPTRCKFVAFMPQWDFLNFWPRRRSDIRPSICGCRRAPTTCSWEEGRVVGSARDDSEGTARSARRSRRSPPTAANRCCARAPASKS